MPPDANQSTPDYVGSMEWTDCLVIEVVSNRMSGAPVLRRSRVRPEDLIGNLAEGAEWMADTFGLPLEDVQAVLDFYHMHQGELAFGLSPHRGA